MRISTFLNYSITGDRRLWILWWRVEGLKQSHRAQRNLLVPLQCNTCAWVRGASFSSWLPECEVHVRQLVYTCLWQYRWSLVPWRSLQPSMLLGTGRVISFVLQDTSSTSMLRYLFQVTRMSAVPLGSIYAGSLQCRKAYTSAPR
jgi:hypothetical protein